MARRLALSWAVLLVALWNIAAAAEPPNIIFILTDDQGYGDLGVAGHPYLKTPNLDRLAQQGTRFTQFYVNNPVCSPTRTAFMTGQYPARLRIHGHLAAAQLNRQRNMPDWLDPDVSTVCDMLQQAGYATAHFGKWHLGSGAGAPAPDAYGLDEHRTVNSSGPSWTPGEGQDPYFRAKSTGLFVDETIRFIEAHPDQPFYVQLWTLVPHAKLQPTPDELAVYQGLDVRPELFQSYMQQYAAAAPQLDEQARVYAAAMTGMDAAVGRLLDYLDEHQLSQNTLILFAADNGPEDYHIRNAANAGMGSPGALRGRKRSIYEGGVRVPCIVRWPGKVAAGSVNEQAVWTGVDWLPTLCAIAGVDPPSQQLDGEDVSDILTGSNRPRRKPIFWQWRFRVAGDPVYEAPPLAIRAGDWKLLMSPDRQRVELYDLARDPQERTNLARQHTDLVARLSDQLLEWEKTLPE